MIYGEESTIPTSLKYITIKYYHQERGINIMDEKKTPEAILAKAIKDIVKVIASAVDEIIKSNPETTSPQSKNLNDLMVLTKPLLAEKRYLSRESIIKICRFVYDNIKRTIESSSPNIEKLRPDRSYYAPKINSLYFYAPGDLKIRVYEKSIRTDEPFLTGTVVMCITTHSNINCHIIRFEINKKEINTFEYRTNRFYDEFDEEMLMLIEKVKFIMNMVDTVLGEMT